ncbi:hypothetical protein [Mycolicibacterium sediminis]|uniref:Diacylglycerol O-acyltransferase n=1 Tax=Mycolicibacterium sediminis TaxID=1286180 RepID=A0A7I7QV32_9MYCO|nr:hypothetical protein [Mycolicibacterium sediminis]BBY29756.1 hypothetical protein MSEDJ_38520 [Mycolicibacterium sediminis]
MTSTDRLAYIDQATFLSWQATGRAQLAQYVWVYERAVNLAGVERFHRGFGHGLAGRLIEPSVLPFGRHRWVSAAGPPRALDVADPRPRADLGDWIDERSQLPVDPVAGPGWHLGVLPMTDGATAVSLVMSHCLLDGGASLRTMARAVRGERCDFGYDAPGSRTRWQRGRSDARQTVADLPEFARTVARAARFAYRRRGEISSSGATRPASTQTRGGTVVLPAVSAIVDAADWEARAADLGGTTYALLPGFGALLGRRLGRVRDDGAVTALIAVSDRAGDDDQRGNAMKIATAIIEPASVTTDLGPTRAAVRKAFAEVRDVPDETHALLPITPFVPRRAVRRTADVLFGDLPVSCSNLGEVPPEMARPDGTEADHVLFRPVDQNVSRDAVERAGGQLVLAAGRVLGTVSIGVVGYQVGAANTREWLADRVCRTLGELSLEATII